MPTFNSSKRVLVVADYGENDLAFHEVKQRLLELNPSQEIDLLSVQAFDTRETAYAVGAAARSGQYDAIYHNTAPRFDSAASRAGNHGEGLAYAKIQADNGREVEVVGVAASKDGNHTFAHLVHGGNPAPEVRDLAFTSIGSQFRSRDEFAPAFAKILAGDYSGLGEDITASIAPLTEDSQALERARTNFQRVSQKTWTLDGGERNYRNGYVTVITTPELAQRQKEILGALYPTKIIDVLPITAADEKSFGTQAGFAGAQLAYNATHPTSLGREVIAAWQPLEVIQEGGKQYLDPLQFRFARQRPHDRNITFKANFDAFVDYASLDAKAGGKLTLAFADGYGNCKLSLSRDEALKQLKEQAGFELAEDETARVRVTIRGRDGKPHSLDAYLSEASFGVPQGQTSFSRGSSGWQGAPSDAAAPWAERNGFTEIFLRGGNAWKALGEPTPGSEVKVEFLGKEKKPSPSSVVSGNGSAETHLSQQRAI